MMKLDEKALEAAAEMVSEMLKLRYAETNNAPAQLVAHNAITAYLSAVCGDAVEVGARAIMQSQGNDLGLYDDLTTVPSDAAEPYLPDAQACLQTAFPALMAENQRLREALAAVMPAAAFGSGEQSPPGLWDREIDAARALLTDGEAA